MLKRKGLPQAASPAIAGGGYTCPFKRAALQRKVYACAQASFVAPNKAAKSGAPGPWPPAAHHTYKGQAYARVPKNWPPQP